MPPKPRSMQSRFILMEGATIAVALVLMAGALSLSAAIRSQFASGVEALQQQIALQTQVHDALDNTVLGFWRYYGSNNASLLTQYRKSEAALRTLTKRAADTAVSQAHRDAVAELSTREDDFLGFAGQLAAGPQNEKTDEPKFNKLTNRELRVRNVLRSMEQKQFQDLSAATHKLGRYSQWLRILVLVLGVFPLTVMLWFRRAHDRRIWAPLEQLHGMVMEVQRGNLDVRGEVPETVELGSLTTAFLVMACELKGMRDSLEEKVRERAAQLEAAHKDLLRAAKLASLGQLVSGVAHEINNPLTSILGFSEVVLGRPGLDPSMRTQLQVVRDEALRLKHLVANLSRISRRGPRQLHRMDLRTVPARMLQLRSYQLAANNVRLQYTPAKEPIWVKGDADLLLQVMLQLALNAEQSIRESREKGEIRLKCDVWDARARITVEDNGCGMAAEVRDHVFDPFFTNRPMWQGTGLGLSVCHSIVEQHDGEVGVESEVGRGTTIRVLLPLATASEDFIQEHGSAVRQEEPQIAVSNKPAEVPARADPARRFLVIDDETEILNLVSFVLAKTGATVVTLQDSTRLDSILNQQGFDAVLCDLKMPGQDGLSVLRTLRQAHPALARKFLLMTGNLADADKAQIELEGVPVLPKPFTLVRLRAMVGEILSSNP
ncbi:MAG TPA: ATP-binding protein [Candidatus Limnocylindrales bacterium]|nr:ATP-binding protein [Candidatus Limnocylindrales bacterium]